MVFVYSNISSERLFYSLNVIFNTILRVDYKIVSKDEFLILDDNSIRINYSDETFPDVLKITPHSIISEVDIKNHEIEVEWLDKVPCFFKTAGNQIFNYDLFACVFYMVSRYEEYLNFDLDKHGRFRAESSLAYKNKFLELPVVNIWVLQLKKELQKTYPKYGFVKREYKYLNTFDIDVAYEYKGKRNLLLFVSTIRSWLKLDILEIKARAAYFFKGGRDSYDVYEYIENLQSKYKTENMFFFQMGDYGKYDKSLSHKSIAFRSLINRTKVNSSVGVHPSYESNHNVKILAKEIRRLEGVVDSKITNSRQHFLKLSMPETYENLIKLGIKRDYTMGFASQVGFRAGICTTYPFFNLIENKERDLLIVPFQVMDGTLHDYLNLSPIEALKKIEFIVGQVQRINGTFVSLWHNSSLSEKGEWKNWRGVFEGMLKVAKDRK